jgi:hypothetical protein
LCHATSANFDLDKEMSVRTHRLCMHHVKILNWTATIVIKTWSQVLIKICQKALKAYLVVMWSSYWSGIFPANTFSPKTKYKKVVPNLDMLLKFHRIWINQTQVIVFFLRNDLAVNLWTYLSLNVSTPKTVFSEEKLDMKVAPNLVRHLL